MPDLPSHARVVIIGGGIVGCSVAYHLAKRGCKDVLLLERRQLTCGTTWHAAGLVGQLRATRNLTRLAQYTTQLYERLERETGQATGFRQVGSIAVAASEARFQELKRGASMARSFGLEVQILSPDAARERWPLLSTDGLVGAVFLPKDGRTNPVDTTQALARGARGAGVRIVENLKVTGIRSARGRVSGVGPAAKPGGWQGIPENFAFAHLPADLGHIEPLFAAAMRHVPALESAGVQVFFNGPESFTPDDRYLLGEAPELRGLYVAAGFNSIGIQSAGGAGKVLADWILDGHPPFDLWDVDIRRCAPFQRNRLYLRERTVEALGLLYALHWPYRQAGAARGGRTPVVRDTLRAAGACFGEVAGYERANWFATGGAAPRYAYSYGRQNWFEHSAGEHRAVRERVGLF